MLLPLILGTSTKGKESPAEDLPGHSKSASRLSGEVAENKIVVKTSQKHFTIFKKSILCPFMAHPGVC